MVFGTPSFMSPEQLAGQPVTGRSDLYSLGVTLFQLLTGELPLRADSLAALMYQIANQTAPDVRTLRPELPEALARLLLQAMAKQPEARFASGKTMAVALRAVLSANAAQDVVNLQPACAVPTDPTDAFETTQRQPRSEASAPGQAYTGPALNGALSSPR
jgi:serine/threonine protein kinase